MIPYTLGNYIASTPLPKVDANHDAFKASREEVTLRLNRMLAIKGTRTVDDFHRALGKIMWDHVGMSRNAAGLKTAIKSIGELRQQFWTDVRVSGENNFKNFQLERAGRVADFLELGELMAADALQREESCGGHFREEHQTADNEALRDDDKFSHVTAWEYNGVSDNPKWTPFKEHLDFEYVHPAQRSYK